MEKILDFYRQYDEDSRLSIRHKTEFFVTTYHLDYIIRSKDHILDVAAGTGIYTLYYADKGCRVEAMDIVPEHISILNNRIKQTGKDVSANVGNACYLSDFEADEFNTVLNMGAIYHIEEPEIMNCLRENLRVLKPGGYLVIAYINKFDGYEKDKYADYFKFYSPAEMEKYVLDLGLSIIGHIPTDGELFLNFENMIREEEPEQQTQPYQAYCQNLKNLTKYHFWLDENEPIMEITMIKEKFVHAMLITKKQALRSEGPA